MRVSTIVTSVNFMQTMRIHNSHGKLSRSDDEVEISAGWIGKCSLFCPASGGCRPEFRISHE